MGRGFVVWVCMIAAAGNYAAVAMPDAFWSGGPGTQGGPLYPNFYAESCPNAEAIVKNVMVSVVQRDPRMAASILRLHFHDCFVNGCDGSVLLDDTPSFQGEKTANPNLNSARGFEVIDEIKCALERECEGVVSCADALAIAARDSVVLTGGRPWQVLLGRKDSLTASRATANNDIPAPNSTLTQLVNAFAKKGLTVFDLVALSGSHTIGKSRCVSFRQRLYNHMNAGQPDSTLEPGLLSALQSLCPRQGDGNVTKVLDLDTPDSFDNRYFLQLQMYKGVLNSDQVLFSYNPNSQTAAATSGIVAAFAFDVGQFLDAFAGSMVKMGSISPLTGQQGEVRRNCRAVNGREY